MEANVDDPRVVYKETLNVHERRNVPISRDKNIYEGKLP